MVERERLQEGFRRQAAPAAEQMMQIGGGNARGFRDGADRGLRAPMAADMGDGAAHDVVIGRRGGERGGARKAVGKSGLFHGHVHSSYLVRLKAPSHPIPG